MHFDDAISEADLFPGELAPTYYCESCGKELGYPPQTGRCWDCELESEDEREPVETSHR